MIGLMAGLANAARGKGFIPAWLFSLVVGCFIFAATDSWVNPWLHIALCAAGVAIWKSKGWGLYFAAFNGHWNRNESEVSWIDSIGYRFVPFVNDFDLATNRKRGLICMAIRGAVYSIPLFLYLSYAVDWYASLLWPLMAMQGVFYWVAFWVKNDYNGGLQVSFAECCTIWFMLDLINLL